MGILPRLIGGARLPINLRRRWAAVSVKIVSCFVTEYSAANAGLAFQNTLCNTSHDSNEEAKRAVNDQILRVSRNLMTYRRWNGEFAVNDNEQTHCWQEERRWWLILTGVRYYLK